MMLFLAIPLLLSLITLVVGCKLLLKTDDSKDPNMKFCRIVTYVVISVSIFVFVCISVTAIRMTLNARNSNRYMGRCHQRNVRIMNRRAMKKHMMRLQKNKSYHQQGPAAPHHLVKKQR